MCKNCELKEEVLRSRTETCLARCTYILPHWQHSTSSRTEHNFETDISGLDAAEVDATTGSSKVRFWRTPSLSSGHNWQLSTHLFCLVARTQARHVAVCHHKMLRLQGSSRKVECSRQYDYPRSRQCHNIRSEHTHIVRRVIAVV